MTFKHIIFLLQLFIILFVFETVLRTFFLAEMKLLHP